MCKINKLNKSKMYKIGAKMVFTIRFFYSGRCSNGWLSSCRNAPFPKNHSEQVCENESKSITEVDFKNPNNQHDNENMGVGMSVRDYLASNQDTDPRIVAAFFK